MLNYSEYLNRIIAEFYDPWDNIVSEVSVGTNTVFFGGNS